MSRFEYKVLEDKQIEISVWGRGDLKDKDGKYVDTFTVKYFLIDPKEVIELQHLLFNAGADFCSKFKCKLDSPECH